MHERARLVLWVLVVLLAGCSKRSAPGPTDAGEPPSNAASGVLEAHRLFQAELSRRGVKFTRLPDGRYALEANEWKVTASLDNVAKDFAANRDPKRITSFVDRTLNPEELTAWPEAEALVFWVAEPAAHDFGTALHQSVSEKIDRVLALVDLTKGTITWISSEQLGRWKVPLERVTAAANRNIARALEGKAMLAKKSDDGAMGFIPLNPALKASAVLSPEFRRFVEADFGWPVIVISPCRDVLFVLAERDTDLLARMGGVVRDDHRECAYPLSTEVLRVSDAGVETIGSFPE
jgi:hypothetical protein